jgi:spore coat-associated protein N
LRKQTTLSEPPSPTTESLSDSATDETATTVDEHVSGGKRLGWLLRHSRMWILALVVLAIAAALAVGSVSLFTSSSANPANTFTAGTLSHTNSKEGAAILTATSMVPGETQTGQVTITNTGDVSGKFRLSSSNLTDTPGPNGGRLSEVLKLKVVDSSRTPRTIYDGRYNALPSTDLGTWAKGEAHTYRFTVTFPNGGVPQSATTGDNAYKGSSTKIQFNWDATS